MEGLALWQAAVVRMDGCQRRVVLLLSSASKKMNDPVRHGAPSIVMFIPQGADHRRHLGKALSASGVIPIDQGPRLSGSGQWASRGQRCLARLESNCATTTSAREFISRTPH